MQALLFYHKVTFRLRRQRADRCLFIIIMSTTSTPTRTPNFIVASSQIFRSARIVQRPHYIQAMGV